LKLKSVCYLTVLLSIFSILGCSGSNVRDNDFAHETNSSTQYLLPAFEQSNKIINEILSIQVNRMNEAWQAGPTFYDKVLAFRNGENVEENWEPNVIHPIEELNALKKYRESAEIALIFKPTPASVLVDDKTTLIAIPHNWIWSEGYENTNYKVDRYLKLLSKVLKNTSGVISIKSFESPYKSLSNSQWLSKKRAERIKSLLIQSGNLDGKFISAYGLGFKQSDFNISPSFNDGRIEITLYSREVDTDDLLSQN